MSFYRSLLAAVAAIAIASPVFADDTTSSPSAPAAPAATSTDASTPATASADQQADATKVNVNKASSKDLMKVKGMSASKAKAVVAYRKKHGDFKTIDDLAKVKGFSKLKSDDLKAIEDQLTIE